MTAMWNERLITRARAADLCGTWALTSDPPYLRCTICKGNVMMLPAPGSPFTVDALISAVLGHMVKCHHYSLSGGPQHGDLAEPA